MRSAIASAVGSSAQVQTAAQQDRFTLDGLKQFIGIIRTVLLVFGLVAVFVGAFTIFNTLSITVAQRSREFGLLRMVGASRRQVLGSVCWRRSSLGLIASLIGIGAGIGIAKGLDAVFTEHGPRAASRRASCSRCARSRCRCSSARWSRSPPG